MKRYLLFVFEYYYPEGGWDDLYMDRDNLETAHLIGRRQIQEDRFLDYHIIDTRTWKRIEKMEV